MNRTDWAMIAAIILVLPLFGLAVGPSIGSFFGVGVRTEIIYHGGILVEGNSTTLVFADGNVFSKERPLVTAQGSTMHWNCQWYVEDPPLFINHTYYIGRRIDKGPFFVDVPSFYTVKEGYAP